MQESPKVLTSLRIASFYLNPNFPVLWRDDILRYGLFVIVLFIGENKSILVAGQCLDILDFFNKHDHDIVL